MKTVRMTLCTYIRNNLSSVATRGGLDGRVHPDLVHVGNPFPHEDRKKPVGRESKREMKLDQSNNSSVVISGSAS